mmetsp:Transcript_289/g.300  ORF Transcript_289/g.300 Transcript_289/m.300 type:complete len:250 (-) Transcript_289:424-1173(-)
MDRAAWLEVSGLFVLLLGGLEWHSTSFAPTRTTHSLSSRAAPVSAGGRRATSRSNIKANAAFFDGGSRHRIRTGREDSNTLCVKARPGTERTSPRASIDDFSSSTKDLHILEVQIETVAVSAERRGRLYLSRIGVFTSSVVRTASLDGGFVSADDEVGTFAHGFSEAEAAVASGTEGGVAVRPRVTPPSIAPGPDICIPSSIGRIICPIGLERKRSGTPSIQSGTPRSNCSPPVAASCEKLLQFLRIKS